MGWISLLGLRAFADRWRAYSIEGALALDDRATLFGLEFQEYKRGIVSGIGIALGLVAVTIVMLTVLSAAVVVQFWDSPNRTMVAWIVAGLWVVLWAVGAAALFSLINKAGDGFAGTRRELSNDWREIKERL